MRSEALKKAQNKYEKSLREKGITRNKFIQMKCHIVNDKDVLEYLQKKENKSGYLKELVRKDMKREESQ